MSIPALAFVTATGVLLALVLNNPVAVLFWVAGLVIGLLDE